jgi:hypothetical protein
VPEIPHAIFVEHCPLTGSRALDSDGAATSVFATATSDFFREKAVDKNTTIDKDTNANWRMSPPELNPECNHQARQL